MHRLRRYHSPLKARLAASHLQHHGIPATVGDSHTANTLGIGHLNLPFIGYDLFIAHKGLADRAAELLDAFETAEPMDTNELDLASEPDLSLLDPRDYPLSCERCTASLPLEDATTACPACGLAVDIVERLVMTHGPEALEHAYPPADAPDEHTRVTMEQMPLPCAQCGYDLAGLPASGRCPECGSLFDKRDMLRSL
jgi:rubrerythrin